MAKKAANTPPPLSLKSYIIKFARKLELYKCYQVGDIANTGMGHIMVSRQKKNGEVIMGSYLIDTYCLGLKDTFYLQFPNINDFEDQLATKFTFLDTCEEISSQLAHNMVYGAIEYAEDLHFKPHIDFNITQHILDDVDDVEYMDIEFGYEGKPLFTPGPSDKTDIILAHLDKYVGKGNYLYVNG
jgi:hypothetical protein